MNISDVNHLSTLIKQGEFLQLAIDQKLDITWQSYVHNLSKGTMKFLLNASINTLPTQDNLKLWNKSFSDKCHLCGNKDSCLHTLAGCPVALTQGRFTWRHDSVISYIVSCVDSKFKVKCDIKGHKEVGGGTISPTLVVTAERPDIVITDEHAKTVEILELTVPHERNIEARHTNKCDRYAWMLTDIVTMKPILTCFEIGCRGLITNDNRERLISIYSKYCRKDIKKKTFLENCSSLAAISSRVIFNMRKEPTFPELGYIGAPFK